MFGFKKKKDNFLDIDEMLMNVTTQIEHQELKVKKDEYEIANRLSSVLRAGKFRHTRTDDSKQKEIVLQFDPAGDILKNSEQPSTTTSRIFGLKKKEMDQSSFRLIKKNNKTESYLTGTSLSQNSGKSYTEQIKDYVTESDISFALLERYATKDSILSKTIKTSVAHAMRADWTLVPNLNIPNVKEAVVRKQYDIIMVELNKLLYTAGITWKQLIYKQLYDIWTFGNSLILKERSGGKIIDIVLDDLFFYWYKYSATKQRVTGYYREPFIRPKPGSEYRYNGNNYEGFYNKVALTDSMVQSLMISKKFQLEKLSSDRMKEYKPNDIVHLKYNIESSSAVGMSPQFASTNDVQDLRNLEESLIQLAWNYGNPVMIVTVDTTGLRNVDEVEEEITKVKTEIENMEEGGFAVVTEKIKIELKYPDGTNIPLDKYVEYIKNRTIKNTDTSGLLMGDGGDAGRQAGEVIDVSATNIIMTVCEVIAEQLEQQLFLDIFKSNAGGGQDIFISPVKIKINEINHSKKATYNNMLLNLASKFIIPPSRLITLMGEAPITDDEQKEISKYRSLIGTEMNTASSNPTNQHGETTAGTVKD